MERLGKWPTRLAKGYTALIPKEGPPGPLNTRPLTVLSLVYRLWVGVRLVDVGGLGGLLGPCPLTPCIVDSLFLASCVPWAPLPRVLCTLFRAGPHDRSFAP